MKPGRSAGWLTGIVVFASMTALTGAVLVSRTAAGADDEIAGGQFALSLAVRVVPLALASGLLVAGISASRQGCRAAVIAAILSFVAVGLWMAGQPSRSPRAPGEDPIEYGFELLATFATTGTTVALAAAVVAWWIARHALGRDGAERVLALETTDLPRAQSEWGAAMRAELASIDDPGLRGRFARSAAMAALRRGTGPRPVVLAALAGVGAGVVVFCAARISFDRPRDRGIVSEPIMGLVVLILVASVITGTLMGRSFRAGLETAVLAWLFSYVCTLAVEIPQAHAWYQESGILLLDGEGAANNGVDALGAALQPVTHSAYILLSLSLLVIAVLAAAFGAVVLRVARQHGRLRPAET